MPSLSPDRPLGLRVMNTQRFVDWSFTHYLEICSPSYALERPRPEAAPSPELAAAS